MLWLNFLHFYQPANIERSKLLEAIENSYEYLLDLLERYPDFKISVNFTGGLLERMATDLNKVDVLERYRRLIERGQVEVVGSAAYHALLPLISSMEVKAQILEQEALLLRHLKVPKPEGFFLPELACSKRVAKIIKKLGYKWIIVDEITAFGTLGRASTDVYVDSSAGLNVVVRNRSISESYVPETMLKTVTTQNNSIVITATDAELYGLRHHDADCSLEKLISRSDVKTNKIGAYISDFLIMNNPAELKLVDSNWQSTTSDLKRNVPFKLWSDPDNEIHMNLSKLSRLAESLFYRHQSDENIWWSRWHLWRGLQSCAWWWASRHDFREVFGPLAWSPDEVDRGVNELIRSIRSLEKSTDLRTKNRAEKLAQKIRTQVWLKHWN